MSNRDVFIVSAVRTPIGAFCGSLSSLKASDLGSIVIKESLARVKSIQPTDISEVILGQALTADEGQNPARQAAIKAGLPTSVPAYLVNMLCGSGLKSVVNGYFSIKNGEGDVIIAGGQESMSQTPHTMYVRNGVKLGDGKMIDTLLHDGLTDPFNNIHMGITAENIAEKYKIKREDQDAYSVESQKRVANAITKGVFTEEIVPVTVLVKRESVLISKDEFPKPNTNLESLKKLKPAFKPIDGTVTPGNSSGINDGAAVVILMSAESAKSKGISPLARIVAVAQTGLDPKIMGMGPVSAVNLLLEKANWTKDEVDLYELNEAFAVQSLACIRELGLNPSKVNIHGGAIALGHPIGASGTRILVSLLNSLKITGGRKGVATLCIGGGMGIAIAVERV